MFSFLFDRFRQRNSSQTEEAVNATPPIPPDANSSTTEDENRKREQPVDLETIKKSLALPLEKLQKDEIDELYEELLEHELSGRKTYEEDVLDMINKRVASKQISFVTAAAITTLLPSVKNISTSPPTITDYKDGSITSSMLNKSNLAAETMLLSPSTGSTSTNRSSENNTVVSSNFPSPRNSIVSFAPSNFTTTTTATSFLPHKSIPLFHNLQDRKKDVAKLMQRVTGIKLQNILRSKFLHQFMQQLLEFSLYLQENSILLASDAQLDCIFVLVFEKKKDVICLQNYFHTVLAEHEFSSFQHSLHLLQSISMQNVVMIECATHQYYFMLSSTVLQCFAEDYFPTLQRSTIYLQQLFHSLCIGQNELSLFSLLQHLIQRNQEEQQFSIDVLHMIPQFAIYVLQYNNSISLHRISYLFYRLQSNNLSRDFSTQINLIHYLQQMSNTVLISQMNFEYLYCATKTRFVKRQLIDSETILMLQNTCHSNESIRVVIACQILLSSITYQNQAYFSYNNSIIRLQSIARVVIKSIPQFSSIYFLQSHALCTILPVSSYLHLITKCLIETKQPTVPLLSTISRQMIQKKTFTLNELQRIATCSLQSIPISLYKQVTSLVNQNQKWNIVSFVLYLQTIASQQQHTFTAIDVLQDYFRTSQTVALDRKVFVISVKLQSIVRNSQEAKMNSVQYLHWNWNRHQNYERICYAVLPLQNNAQQKIQVFIPKQCFIVLQNCAKCNKIDYFLVNELQHITRQKMQQFSRIVDYSSCNSLQFLQRKATKMLYIAKLFPLIQLLQNSTRQNNYCISLSSIVYLTNYQQQQDTLINIPCMQTISKIKHVHFKNISLLQHDYRMQQVYHVYENIKKNIVVLSMQFLNEYEICTISITTCWLQSIAKMKLHTMNDQLCSNLQVKSNNILYLQSIPTIHYDFNSFSILHHFAHTILTPLPSNLTNCNILIQQGKVNSLSKSSISNLYSLIQFYRQQNQKVDVSEWYHLSFKARRKFEFDHFNTIQSIQFVNLSAIAYQEIHNISSMLCGLARQVISCQIVDPCYKLANQTVTMNDANDFQSVLFATRELQISFKRRIEKIKLATLSMIAKSILTATEITLSKPMYYLQSIPRNQFVNSNLRILSYLTQVVSKKENLFHPVIETLQSITKCKLSVIFTDITFTMHYVNCVYYLKQEHCIPTQAFASLCLILRAKAVLQKNALYYLSPIAKQHDQIHYHSSQLDYLFFISKTKLLHRFDSSITTSLQWICKSKQEAIEVLEQTNLFGTLIDCGRSNIEYQQFLLNKQYLMILPSISISINYLNQLKSISFLWNNACTTQVNLSKLNHAVVYLQSLVLEGYEYSKTNYLQSITRYQGEYEKYTSFCKIKQELMKCVNITLIPSSQQFIEFVAISKMTVDCKLWMCHVSKLTTLQMQYHMVDNNFDKLRCIIPIMCLVKKEQQEYQFKQLSNIRMLQCNQRAKCQLLQWSRDVKIISILPRFVISNSSTPFTFCLSPVSLACLHKSSVSVLLSMKNCGLHSQSRTQLQQVEMQQEQHSLKLIQAVCRGFFQRRQHQSQLQKVVLIQSKLRNYFACKSFVKRYQIDQLTSSLLLSDNSTTISPSSSAEDLEMRMDQLVTQLNQQMESKDEKEATTVREQINSVSQAQDKHVSLQGVGLHVIPEDLIRVSHHVESVDLSGNYISHIPSWFLQRFSHAKSINLSDNQIHSLPQEFEQFKQLQQLNLNGNRIEFFPTVITKLPKLKQLKMANNILVNLPNTIEEMKELEQLDVSQNWLTSVPEEVTKLKAIKEVRIEGNELLLQSEKLLLSKNRNLFTTSSLKKIESASVILSESMMFDDLTEIQGLGSLEEEEDDVVSSASSVPNSILSPVPLLPITPQTPITPTPPFPLLDDLALLEKNHESMIEEDQHAKPTTSSVNVNTNRRSLELTNTSKKASKMEKNAMKQIKDRVYALMEILESERKYVTFLNILYDKYYIPLTNGQIINTIETVKSSRASMKPTTLNTTPIVPTDIAKKMFPSNLPSIIATNKNLLEKLEKRYGVYMNSQQPLEIYYMAVGDIFVHVAPFLKTLGVYSAFYEAAMTQVRRAKQSFPAFSQWLDVMKLDGQVTQGQDLPSLLIMPHQRIPRYTLLLQSVLKHTPTDHVDYGPITEAIELFQELAQFQNQKVDETNTIYKMNVLAKQYKLPDLVQPYRKLVKESNCMWYSSKKPISIHLFSDMLLVHERNVGILNKSISIYYYLENSKLISSGSHTMSIQAETIHPKKGRKMHSLEFQFTSPEETQQFCKSFCQILEELKFKTPRLALRDANQNKRFTLSQKLRQILDKWKAKKRPSNSSASASPSTNSSRQSSPRSVTNKTEKK